MGLLDGQLRKAIADGFRGKLLRGTLHKVTVIGRDSNNGDPITAAVDYPVQGFRETYSAFYRATAGIPDTDSRIMLIAGLSGAAPAIGDKAQINGGWYALRNVSIDPAGATYDCQAYATSAPT